jgi:Glycosyl transferase family 2
VKRLNIGLLMTYNEQDVLPEMLLEAERHVDAIFALDGSSDDTLAILRAHEKVHRVFLDAEVAPNVRIRDAHRQVLLDAARAEFGRGHWYTLLHADEFFHDDPREMIVRAEREGAGFVNWASMQFFMHTTDRDLFDTHGHPLEPSVRRRLRWYSPFWIEVRQFLDEPGLPWLEVAYRPGEHGRVFPRGTRFKPFSRMPVLKHYPYRSPAQMNAKSGASGFSVAHAQPQAIFRETAQPIYRSAHRLGHPETPDFGVFELSRQPSLLAMLVRQRGLLNRASR